MGRGASNVCGAAQGLLVVRLMFCLSCVLL
jgi:hypothetical protein